MNNVTQILEKIEQGESSAPEKLLSIVYDELRRLAAVKIDQEKPGQTLQATALVHEAWLRLVDVDYTQNWTSRRHFYGAAAEAMRRILVEKARRQKRQKHGGDRQQITIQLEELPEQDSDDLIETLHDALNRFAEIDAVGCELVKLRYFAGLSLRDAGQALDLPPRSADRLWAYAKVWLQREVDRETGNQ